MGKKQSSQDLVATARNPCVGGSVWTLQGRRNARLAQASSCCLDRMILHPNRHNRSSILTVIDCKQNSYVMSRVTCYGNHGMCLPSYTSATAMTLSRLESIKADAPFGSILILLVYSILLNTPNNYQLLSSNGPLAVDCLSYQLQYCRPSLQALITSSIRYSHW